MQRFASSRWNSAKAAMAPIVLGVSSESVMKMWTNVTPVLKAKRRVAHSTWVSIRELCED